MRKGRYSSSGNTPLDQDVDTTLKQEVDRISREKNSVSKETEKIPPRSPELEAYYFGQNSGKNKTKDPSDAGRAERTERAERTVRKNSDSRKDPVVSEQSVSKAAEKTSSKAQKDPEEQKKEKVREIFSIIGYAFYHFVAMGLIALCVILIYFCFKFYFVSNGKQGRTEYHYHEAGETTLDANL